MWDTRDLLGEVVSHLPPSDRASFACVASAWREARDDALDVEHARYVLEQMRIRASPGVTRRMLRRAEAFDAEEHVSRYLCARCRAAVQQLGECKACRRDVRRRRHVTLRERRHVTLRSRVTAFFFRLLGRE